MSYWLEVLGWWLAFSVVGTVVWAFVVSKVKRWNRPEDASPDDPVTRPSEVPKRRDWRDELRIRGGRVMMTEDRQSVRVDVPVPEQGDPTEGNEP